MADNHIQFRIGSAFSGEGFTKAQNAVKEMNGEVSKSMNGMNAISGAIGQLDANATGAVKAVTGLLNAFTSLSITTGLIQGGVLLINKYIGELNDRLTNIEESWKRIAELNQEMFIKKITGETDRLSASITALSSDYAKLTKEASAFANSLNALKKSEASGSVINLEIEKFNAVIEEMSEQGKKVTAAEYDLEIALKKKENAEAEGTRAVDRAREAYESAEKQLGELEKAEEKAGENFEKASLAFDIVAANYEVSSKEYKAAEGELNAAKKHMAETTAKADELRSTSTNLLLNLNTEEQNLANTTNQHNLEVQKATKALEGLRTGFVEGENCANEFIEEAQKQMDEVRKNELNEAQKELADATTKAKDATSKRAEAEKEYAEALKKYQENWSDNKLFETLFKTSGKYMKEFLKATNTSGLDREMAEQAIKNAIANGDVRTVKDLDKFARQAQREARDKITKSKTQIDREKQRYERLMAQNRKTWSKADADFVEKFTKLKEAAEAQKKDLEDKKARMEAEKKRERENHDNMAKSKALLEQIAMNMGLK